MIIMNSITPSKTDTDSEFKKGRRAHDHELIRCVLLCCALAVLSFAYYIIKNGGFLVLRDDFNTQAIPFLSAMNNNIKTSGLDSWVWNLDLGSGFIQSFAFYGLGSPFVWITFLFPSEAVPYLIGPVCIIKYAIAGMTSFLYLKRYVKDERYATAGAVMYAFCGFQSVNLLYYYFHDAVALFPLLLLGLDMSMDETSHRDLIHRGRVIFVVAIAVNCLSNYFFFVLEAVFLIIYFLFRYRRKLRAWFISVFQTIGCALLGAGLSSFLFIPCIYYIRQNPRSFSLAHLDMSSFVYSLRFYLEYIKGFLIPADVMPDQSAVVPFNYDSASIYLPLVGMTLVIAYLIKKRDRLSAFILTLIVMSFVPILSSLFFALSTDYKRWWFMAALIFILAGLKVMEDPELRRGIIPGAVINCSLIVALWLMCRFVKVSDDFWPEELVFHTWRFALYCGIAVLGSLIVAVLYKTGKLNPRAVTCFAAAAAVLTTFLTLRFYTAGTDSSEYLAEYELGSQLTALDPQYRYTTNDNVETLTGEAAGTGSFSSTVNYSLDEFDALFGYSSPILRMDLTEVSGLRELVGAKYLITDTCDDSCTNGVTISVPEDGSTHYISELDASPIGFAVDHVISADELMYIDVSLRGIAMLDSAAMDPDDTDKVADVAPQWSVVDIDYDIPVAEYAERNKARAVSDFVRDGHGFTCTSDYDTSKLVYFSVPYDEGWSAFVNGSKTEIYDSGGMMAIVVPGGQCSIEFEYHTPGFRAGIIVSSLSIILFTLWLVWYHVKYGTRENLTSKTCQRQ